MLFRSRPNEIQNLAARHGDFAGGLHINLSLGDKFDLEVARRHGQAILACCDQDVSQDRHRLSAFDHSYDGLDRLEEGFTLCLELLRITRLSTCLLSWFERYLEKQ